MRESFDSKCHQLVCQDRNRIGDATRDFISAYSAEHYAIAARDVCQKLLGGLGGDAARPGRRRELVGASVEPQRFSAFDVDVSARPAPSAFYCCKVRSFVPV